MTHTKRFTHSSIRIQEDASLSPIFNVFRKNDIDVTWVKENIYGTPCIPETCPRTRNLDDIVGDDIEEGEIREIQSKF